MITKLLNEINDKIERLNNLVQDKEYFKNLEERINKVNKYIEKQEQEIRRLNNIIDKVIEYIKKYGTESENEINYVKYNNKEYCIVASDFGEGAELILEILGDKE